MINYVHTWSMTLPPHELVILPKAAFTALTTSLTVCWKPIVNVEVQETNHTDNQTSNLNKHDLYARANRLVIDLLTPIVIHTAREHISVVHDDVNSTYTISS